LTGPLSNAVACLVAGGTLDADATHAAVAEVMSGEAPEALLAAFLTALRLKGETPDELAGAVRAVRDRMAPWIEGPGPSRRPLLDTCGTGGDGANTVNISTAAAIVAAASGVATAKHGNRSASGNSGSAEVLVEMGVEIEATPERLRRCLAELGLTFLYAPRFHPALRYAATVRRQLPFRTLFNLVGPLANPARPDFQVVGVSGANQAVLVAEALARLGTRRAAVVRGSDGLDEVTLGGLTHVLWVESGTITPKTWSPEDFGLSPVEATTLRVTGPAESAARLLSFLKGEPGPVRRAVLANAAAALLVAERVESLSEGVEVAGKVVDTHQALDLLDRWRSLSRSDTVSHDLGGA
jgi:anthranilate phosphoribosyltransferase